MKKLSLLFFLLCFINGNSQKPTVDSLLNLLKSAKEDSLKVILLDNITWEYMSSDLTNALKYANQELDLSRKLKFNSGVSSSLINFGGIYKRQGDLSKALKYYMDCLKLNEEISNTKNIINSYINIANVYIELREYNKGLTYHLKSLHLSRTILDSNTTHNKYTFAAIYSNVGIAFSFLKNDSSALKYYQIGVSFMEAINDKRSMAGAYNNIGVAFCELKQFNEALKAFETSLRLGEEINSLEDIAYTTISLGRLYKSIGNHQQAIAFLEKALSNPYLIENKQQRLNVYQTMAESFDEMKDYKNKSFYLSKYIELNDSIFTEEKTSELNTLQTKFKTEEIERENTILAGKNKIQFLQLIGLAFFSLFIITIIWLIFRQNKLRSEQQAMQLQQKLLRSQMNPHFIFNSLHAIQKFILKNDPMQAASYLSSFASLTRNVLENSQFESIPLNQEISLLENYLQLQKLRFGARFEYSISVSDDIDTSTINIPPMLAQPFIENAIEHGMKDVDTGGLIEIAFTIQNHLLLFEIKDNGTGIQNIEKKHHSLATQITKERIALLNKKNKLKTIFTITDAFPLTTRKGLKVNFSIPV